ncbi:hypothetical protein KPL70_014742 [Citrus sinensis]|nr:hypothetical protein KPL70_014742 [Citrus sinensis]
MATLNDSTFREGQSTTRPPFFDGNDDAYWKTRMRIYLQVLDYEIWEVVCDGPFMYKFKDEVGDDVPKPSSQWSKLEKRKMSLNSKAMNALFCALDKKEFHRVSSCESAQEIWNKLEVVYEGTNQVKESKISRYTRQYELFQMEQNENVYSMYTRFMDIVNTLGALGKTFSNSEKVKKIIRSLPKEWRPKRTAIEEAKNLNTLHIDDLISSLISYEEDLAVEKGDEEKKKSIALKASKYESDGGSEPDDEELAMLARRFRKFFKKTGERRKFRNFKNQREKKEVITCYECKKPGHIRSECPLINKLKKKAMVATWDDSEEDSSDEEGLQEVSNLALMAIGEDDNLNEVNDPTYDELYDAFKDLHNELMKIGVANDDADGDLQEESSKEVQENAPQKNQEDRQEEQTNMELEQQEDFSSCMSQEFEMSMMGELKYFIGLQIKQNEEGIFINQAKYVKDLLKRFGYDNGTTKSTPMSTTIKLDKDEKGKEVDIKMYRATLSPFRPLLRSRRSIQDMLQPWEPAINLDDRVYPNLVRVFYSNMEISDTRPNRIVTQVSRVPIEFDDVDLADFLVTPRKGHSDGVTRLDIGLLDSLLTECPINLGYVIVWHILSTPTVNHRLLPYSSIITKILRRFEVPLLDIGHMETRRIGPEAMTSIEDDRMLNDIYPPDQLPDFRLGAHHHPPHRRFVPRPPADSDSEERAMDADIPSSSEPPPAPEPSAVPEQPSASMPPPAPVQPPASDVVQQLIVDVHRISECQQLILDRLDTVSRDHQQLRSDFQTFQQQSIDQQLELIAGQRTLLYYFGYDPGSTYSPPP